MGSGAGKGSKGGAKSKSSKSKSASSKKKAEGSSKKKKERKHEEPQGEFGDVEEGGYDNNGDMNDLMKVGEQAAEAASNPLVLFIVVVKALTTIGAINMIIVQFVGGLGNDNIEFIPAAVRVYVVIFSSFVILNEMGLGKKLMGGSSFFANWIIRGAFYGYIGLVGLEQNSLASKSVGIYATIVAWYMIVCGGLYLIMGLLCLQKMYDSLVPDVDELVDAGGKAARVAKSEGLI
mmetsp:Transcript_19548/g.32461  ORF Transcript_19548/g.32461 Transcript_19548/m.32461 type:complete len:234 (-) Transcript_19548:167-868(-)